MSVDFGTAVLDAPPSSDSAPVVAEAPPSHGNDKPQGEATPASERNGKADPAPAKKDPRLQDPNLRQRDESGRFAPKAGDKPEAKPEAKPAAKPEAAKTAIDDATYARAEAVGLTRYAASKLGDGLAAEITRREAAAKPAAPAPAPQPQPEAAPNKPAAPQSAADPNDPVAQLQDLPEEYGELAERDKALRGVISQLQEQIRQMAPLREEFDGLKQRAQQDEQTRLNELARKDALEVDEMIADLGKEFEPIFGKGAYDKIPAPYLAERTRIFDSARALRDVFPDVFGNRPLKDLARGVASLFYPDDFQQHNERETLRRARDAANKQPPSARPSTRDSIQEFTERARDNPRIKELGRRAERERNGEE